MLLLIALTRLVPKAQLGGFQQLGLIYGIVSPLLVAGIPAALLYFIPRAQDADRARMWVGQAYLLLGGLGVAASIAVAAARSSIATALGNPDLSDALLRYAPYPFLAFISAVMPAALIAVGRAGLAAAMNALAGALALVAVLAAVAIQPDTVHMAVGLAAAQLCTALASTYVVRRAVGLAFHRSEISNGVLALLRYGLPLALTGIAGKLAFQFDRLVVSHQFTPALFAVYAVGAVELPLTVIVQQSVNAVLVPALTRYHAAGDIAGMAALWRRAIRRTSLVLMPLFVFFLLTANETIRLLFGASYSESTDIFRVYLFLVPLRVATYGLITQAVGRTQVNVTASLVLLALNAVLVLALVGPLGLIGPAIGTVLATYGMALYYLFRLRAILGLSIAALMPWSLLAINLALSAIAAIPTALLLFLGLGGAPALAIGGLLYSGCYLLVMIKAGRLDAQEIDWIRGAVERTVSGRHVRERRAGEAQ